MKVLLVHFAKDHGNGRIEMAGRCAEEAIFVGDELVIKGQEVRFRVLSIDVYGKQVDCLHPAYVGNLFLEPSHFQPLIRLEGAHPERPNPKRDE